MNNPEQLSVLHLDTGRTFRGGQRQLLLLLEQLQNRDVRSLLAVPASSPLIEPARRLGISVTGFRSIQEFHPGTALRIARLAASQAVSVIHAHDAHAHGLARLAQLMGLNAPLVVHRRVVFPVRPGLVSRWKYTRGVSAYLSLSRAAAGTLRRIGVPEDRIKIIADAVDLEKLDRELHLPWPETLPSPRPDERRLVCVGALEQPKGQRLLLSLLPRWLENHPDLILIFLGDGPDRKHLETMAGSMGLLDHCRFPGVVSSVAPVLKQATALVVPSFSEGFSLATLEAMALGVPVAASASGGPEEIIEAGRDGLLFSPGNLNEMQLAVERLLSDRALCQQLAEAGKQKVQERYSPECLVEKTMKVYRRCMKEE